VALKGQKFNKYSEDFKNIVVEEYLKGQGGYICLGKKYNVSWHSIEDWVKKFKKQGNIKNDINQARGRKKQDRIDYKERYEILKKYQAFLKAQRERK
jgi:transposase-like protein